MPILLSAFDQSFGGDRPVTEGGGSISVDSDKSATFSLGDPSIGARNLPLKPPPSGGKIGFPALFGQAYLQVLTLSESTYARAFSWNFGDINDDYGGGAALGGFLTKPSDIPSTGTMSYMGTTGGQISQLQIEPLVGLAASIKGDVAISAAFASGTVTGQITNIQVGLNNYGVAGPVNVLNFTASFDAATGRFIGEVVAGPSIASTSSFPEGTRGTIVLQAFGPQADNLGAVLIISGPSTRLVATVLASR